MSNRAEILKQRYQQSVGLPFAQVLSEREIAKVLEEQGVSYRQVLYTPMVVVWAWISQVLDEDKSLSNAVKRVTTWLSEAGEERPASDTGGYSKARKGCLCQCYLPCSNAVLKPSELKLPPSSFGVGDESRRSTERAC